MQAYLLNTSWQLSRWRLDWISLLLGFIVGVLLVVGLILLWPRMQATWQALRARYQEMRGRLLVGGSDRYRDELTSFLQQNHPDRDRFTLDQIFVKARFAAPRTANEEDEDPLLTFTTLWPDLGRFIATPPQETINARQLLRGGKRVAISGLAGSGKSTYLSHLAQQMAAATVADNEESADAFLAERLPVFVHLSELDVTVEPAEAVLLEALSRRASALLRPRLTSIWNESLSAGTLFLLLDGLDDLTAPQRLPYLSWLRELVRRQPTMPIIAAAPARGFGPLVKLDFAVVEALTWQKGHAYQLWQNVAAASESKLAGFTSTWCPGQLPFETHLRMLLASEGAEQPTREVDLLEAALRYLLPAANAEPAWLAPVVRELWERLAWTQLTSALGFVDRVTLDQLITAVLVEFDVELKGEDSRLTPFLDNHSLFISGANGNIALRSPVWRDYLAASYLAQVGDLDVIKNRLDSQDWRDVRRFYVARQGAEAIIVELLNPPDKSRRQAGLFEAAQWLAQLPEETNWQNDVLGRLGRLAIQTDAPAALRQRAIVAVAQSRRRGLRLFLERLLFADEPLGREMAVASLTLLPTEVSLDLIRNLLEENENERINYQVITTLATIASPAAQTMLLKMLLSADELTSAHVAESLAWQSGEGWDALRDAATDEDPEVRRAANYGLLLVDEPWAVELVKGLEADSEWIVRAAANSVMEEITRSQEAVGWQQERLGDQPWLIQWAATQRKAVPSGNGALPVILELLENGDDSFLRCAAARTLGQFALADARTILHRTIQSEDARLRDAAYNALCLINRAY